jgi:gliding motility-associated-like protein
MTNNMKKINILFFFIFLTAPILSFSQCRWQIIDSLNFENTNIDTCIVPTAVYHTSPQTFGAQTGNYGLYFNIQNGPPAIPAGTLLYHRTFNVCAGRPNQFSFWYTTCFAGVLCNITVKLYDGPTLINNFVSGAIPTQVWQQYLPPTFTPTTGTLKVEIYTNVTGTGGGNDLGVDNMVLKGCTQLYTNNIFYCVGNSNYNLYDSIPSANMNNTSGAWAGPSVLTNGHLGTYNPSLNTNGTYLYTYNPTSAVCLPDSAILTVNTIVCGNTCPVLTINNDTTACLNSPLAFNAQINTGNIQSVVWSPSWGLSNASIANPTTTATIDTMYHVTVTTLSPISLIANGDFGLGNASFTSGYTYCSAVVPPVPCVTTWGMLSCQGFYTVNTNPLNCHTNFSSFGDHTTGTGNMLIVNGANNPGISVWCQTVPVTPNTNYNLSAWFSNVDPFSGAATLAVLSYEINGVSLGPTFTPAITTGTWTQQSAIWNSGANTTANICIQNSSIFGGGNDFALDDISFNATCILMDSIQIIVSHAPTVVFPNDTSFCNVFNHTIVPTVTGTTAITYLWQNNATTSTFNATTLGTYSMTATNVCGSSTDSMHIVLTTSPTSVDLGPFQTICNQASFSITPTVTGSSVYYLKWQDSSATATFNATTTGLYFVRVYNGCASVWDTVSLIFKNSPTVDLGLSQTLCNQNSFTINPIVTGSATLHYKWQDSTTTSSYIATSTGLYFVRCYNECGSVWDTVSIAFNKSPTVDLGLTKNLCNINPYNLIPTIAGTAPLNYKWQDSSATATYNVTASGLYFVRVYNSCGSVWDTVSINLNFSPTVNVGIDQLVCDITPFTINPIVTGTAPLSYLWQNGSTATTFNANQTNNYVLNVSNMCGTVSDAVLLTFAVSPTLNFTNHIIKQCDLSIINLQPIVVSALPESYLWSNGLTTPTINVTTSGTYILYVTNACKTIADSVLVTIIPMPTKVYNAGEITICNDTIQTLDAENMGAKYIWITLDTTQKIIVNKTGLYTVRITEQNFCSIIDSVYIIMQDCNPGIITMPNAFSPNSDGLNDILYPIKIGENAQLINFKIFNRWGNVVFSSTNMDYGWDGTFSNIEQPIGNYIYTLEYASFQKTETLKGDVTLIR